jgi:xanthine dehydrogenase accessory factor
VNALPNLLQRLHNGPAVLVRVLRVQGSVPRDAGAWMAVFGQDLLGTIGGGHMEFSAIAMARNMLTSGEAPREERFALGPSLGQCCGGVVHVRLERVESADINRLQRELAAVREPVALFGAGHVGVALVQVLAALPFAVDWLDSRDQVFPAQLPDNVQCEHSDPVHAAVDLLATQSRVLIMSFSHAEDLDIVAACLKRQRVRADLPYVGLIGSQSKWASFRQQLLARGFTEEELAHITCPIGVPGIADKRPEVIAIAVAAQLLQVRASQGE